MNVLNAFSHDQVESVQVVYKLGVQRLEIPVSIKIGNGRGNVANVLAIVVKPRLVRSVGFIQMKIKAKVTPRVNISVDIVPPSTYLRRFYFIMVAHP